LKKNIRKIMIHFDDLRDPNRPEKEIVGSLQGFTAPVR
jgi:hypothetical protein